MVEWFDLKTIICIYVFDLNTRNWLGMYVSGTAIMKCVDIFELWQYMFCLSIELNTQLFECAPINISCDLFA